MVLWRFFRVRAHTLSNSDGNLEMSTYVPIANPGGGVNGVGGGVSRGSGGGEE
jgi:hypothetical protein